MNPVRLHNTVIHSCHTEEMIRSMETKLSSTLDQKKILPEDGQNSYNILTQPPHIQYILTNSGAGKLLQEELQHNDKSLCSKNRTEITHSQVLHKLLCAHM